MATRIAKPAVGNPVDWRTVGEPAATRPWIDGELRGRRRVAAAILLGVTAVLFAAPPAVAVLVLDAVIR